MSTPTDFSGEDLIDDAESDAVHDALRANLGLTEDRDVNAARLQQASDFVALVNARLPAATALSPGLIARLRRWIVGGDEAKFPRSAWPTWALAGGLVALVGVGLGVDEDDLFC